MAETEVKNVVSGVEHKEFGKVCRFKKSHKNDEFNTADADRQKSHRASQLVAVCVPAMAKIQADARFKDITDANEVFIKSLALNGIAIDRIDLDRSMTAFDELQTANRTNAQTEVIVPQMATATADTTEVKIPEPKAEPEISLNDGLIQFVLDHKDEYNKYQMETAIKNANPQMDSETLTAYLNVGGYY